MRIFLLAAGCLLFTLVCCNREEDRGSVVERKKEIVIVAAGDSLTAGYGLAEEENYPFLLAEKLRSGGYNCRVVNSGISSETSSGILSRIESILALNPDIVILETGANDGLRRVSPDLLKRNVRDVLFKLKDAGVTAVLVGMRMGLGLGPLYVRKFNAVYPELAEEFDLVYMPFFLQDVAVKPELTISDGMHPNLKGYKIIVENVYPYVLQAMAREEKRLQ